MSGCAMVNGRVGIIVGQPKDHWLCKKSSIPWVQYGMKCVIIHQARYLKCILVLGKFRAVY